MSDQSQGPGWWLASDGKWYPPENNPTAIALPPPPPSVPQASELRSDGPGLPARAWRKYRGWPVWGQVVVGLVVLGVVTAPFASTEDTKEVSTTQNGSEEASAKTTTSREASTATAKPTTTTEAPTTTTAPPPPPTTAPPPPTTVDPFAGESVSQRNAREKAADYLDFSAFSRSGLIDQLKYEGFAQNDAGYGVDALHVDWNEQAAKKAADYLEFSSFSASGLIEQLVYEGFTQAQAEYGVSTTGL